MPAVVFYSDDLSQASDTTYQIVVKSGSNVVKTVSGITVESWAFVDETSLNGGAYFNALTFEISAQKPGYVGSRAILVSVSR